MPEANITPEVVVGITNLLIVAGIDTTWSSIGSALWHLGTNPDDLARLVAEPDLMMFAVEEFLRYYAPVTMARIAEQDIEYNGVHIKNGDKVLMNFPAACHDPEQFDEPRRVHHRSGEEPPHRVRLGHPPLRRFQPRAPRDDHGDQGVHRADPRVPRERPRADEVGRGPGARSRACSRCRSPPARAADSPGPQPASTALPHPYVRLWRMAKTRLEHVCTDCGASHPKWSGPVFASCGQWNTLVEELSSASTAPLIAPAAEPGPADR